MIFCTEGIRYYITFIIHLNFNSHTTNYFSFVQGKPMLAVRWPFVIQMSRLYTRAAFRLFEEALQDSTDLRISQDHDFRNGWIVSHTKRSEKHDWCQKQFKLIADVDAGVFTCECKQWEHTCPFFIPTSSLIYARIKNSSNPLSHFTNKLVQLISFFFMSCRHVLHTHAPGICSCTT